MSMSADFMTDALTRSDGITIRARKSGWRFWVLLDEAPEVASLVSSKGVVYVVVNVRPSGTAAEVLVDEWTVPTRENALPEEGK